MTSWQVGAALLVAGAYAVLSHVLMVRAPADPWTLAALLWPAIWLAGAWVWRIGRWHSLAAALLGAAVISAAAAVGSTGQIGHLYLLQHVGIHVALGVGFFFSLRGELSVIGCIARTVHGSLTPQMLAYTRKLTWAWVGYFFGMGLCSIWVHAFLSWSAWSLLANVLTPAAIGLLFFGEYLLRYRLHPEFERVSLVDGVMAYRRKVQAREAGGQ